VDTFTTELQLPVDTTVFAQQEHSVEIQLRNRMLCHIAKQTRDTGVIARSDDAAKRLVLSLEVEDSKFRVHEVTWARLIFNGII
jgi:hypothetical protein